MPLESGLRATQQIIEVLGTGDSATRVTRQLVEVLGDVNPYVFASNTLDLTDQARYVGALVERNVSDTLLFVDFATFEVGYVITDILNLLDSATYLRGAVGIASNVLNLSDEVDWRGPRYIKVQHSLGLQQEVAEHVSIVNKTVEHLLNLSHRVGKTAFASASNILSLFDSGMRLNTGISILAFIDMAMAGIGKDGKHDLSLVQQVEINGTYQRSSLNDLNLIQSVTYVVFGPCITHLYTPFVGSSTDTTIIPPSITAPTLGTATLTLTYPFISPTSTVILRNPEFNNKDILNFNRVSRQTRGGTLIIFADSSWPKTQTLQVEIRALKQSQAVDLLGFFGESLGKEIGLLDHENRQWRGIITEPNAPIFNPGRKDLSVSFMFEGELV